jgi:hypothetical protein
MKYQKIKVLIAVMALAGSAVSMQAVVTAADSSQTKADVAVENSQTEADMADQASDSETAGQETTELSEDWKDYQIKIEDQVYQFPMTVTEFEALGWTANEDDLSDLQPNQYNTVRFTKGDAKCTVYVINLGKNTLPASECLAGGISIDHFDWPLEEGSTITLPGGIERGVSDAEAIEAAYGTPSDTYEGDLYKEYTYKTDSYSNIELQVYNETGLLESLRIRNFVEPEGFDAGEVSTEVPQLVSSYTKPESLSETPADYQIELDGEVYELPVPVSVLSADGWELDDSASDSEISAGSFGWVVLQKGGQQIREIAVNPEDYATIPENCWIEELTIGGYTLEAEGGVTGGISVGMTEADFLQVLEDNGIDYELTSESGNFKYYTYNKKAYDQCFEATIYTGEDGQFPENTIMELTCSNAFD